MYYRTQQGSTESDRPEKKTWYRDTKLRPANVRAEIKNSARPVGRADETPLEVDEEVPGPVLTHLSYRIGVREKSVEKLLIFLVVFGLTVAFFIARLLLLGGSWIDFLVAVRR